jgi:hypothetical protein
MAWLRALVRWLEGGDWHSFDVDHCCAGCEETVARLQILLCDYTAQPFDGDQRLIDKRFNEIVRRSW